jgi:hypothetical protein
MAILYPGAAGPDEIIEQAHRLADDVERLLSRGMPTDANLAGAPIIDLYRPAPRAVTALIGVMTGHPTVTDRRPGLTTEVFALDADADRPWARTWSRWYLLGRPGDSCGGRRH